MLRDKKGLTEKEFLEQYHVRDYERPSVAADMVIFTVAEAEEDNYRLLPKKELKILLIKRGGHPCLGCWALPGGFVCPDETTEQAAARELYEETGVKDVYLEQLYTLSDPGRDPRAWVMSCSYLALVDSSHLKVEAGDDAVKAEWFHLSYDIGEDCIGKLKLSKEGVLLTAEVRREKNSFLVLKNDGLAFDHAQIIARAIERLRGKLKYSDIALNLMPDLFTLTQLQQVYEVILGEKLLKAAFRRKISHLLEETDQFTENAGHRPSRLFCKKCEKKF